MNNPVQVMRNQCDISTIKFQTRILFHSKTISWFLIKLFLLFSMTQTCTVFCLLLLISFAKAFFSASLDSSHISHIPTSFWSVNIKDTLIPHLSQGREYPGFMVHHVQNIVLIGISNYFFTTFKATSCISLICINYSQ